MEVEPQPLFRFLLESLFHSIRLARRFRPGFVYAASGLTALAAVISGRLVSAPVLCFAHGLDLIAPSRLYRLIWLKAIRSCDMLLVNSRYTCQLAQEAGIPAGKIRVICPGVELPDWTDSAARRLSFRTKHKIDSRPMLLFVGRLTERKGLAPFISKALPTIVRRYPDLRFVIVGSGAQSVARRGANESNRIMAAAIEAGVEANIVFTGSLSDDDLRSAYYAAEVFVFPVLDLPGDVEGFGMVAVEAAAHGLPTVGFSVGGVLDAIADGKSGWLVPSGEYILLSEKVVDVLEEDSRTPSLHESCIEHARRFSWNIFESKVDDYVAELIDR